MQSYREGLKNIGLGPGTSNAAPGGSGVSYNRFWVKSHSFRANLRSMFAPTSYAQVSPGAELDKSWTEECQSVAFAHNRWFFVSNAAGAQTLHVFDGKAGKQTDVLTRRLIRTAFACFQTLPPNCLPSIP